MHSVVSPAGMRCKALWKKELKFMPSGGETWLIVCGTQALPRKKASQKWIIISQSFKGEGKTRDSLCNTLRSQTCLAGLCGSFSVQQLPWPWPDEWWELKWVCAHCTIGVVSECYGCCCRYFRNAAGDWSPFTPLANGKLEHTVAFTNVCESVWKEASLSSFLATLEHRISPKKKKLLCYPEQNN